MKNVDLMYFGYTWEEDSQILEKIFIDEVSKKFPTVKFENAFDDIKGYRQSVFLEENLEDDYLTFILAHGWLNCSMTLQLLMYNNKEKLSDLFDRVKSEYPECLKNS